jgi:uncharacterized membrane protein
MQRGDPQRLWCDDTGRVRVMAATSSFDGLVDLSFNQIRQASASHPDILIRLMDTLAALAEAPRTDGQAASLTRHMDSLLETGRQSIGHTGDLAVLSARYDIALSAVGSRRTP